MVCPKLDLVVLLFGKLNSYRFINMVQVMGLIQVVVCTAASKLECQLQSEQAAAIPQDISPDETTGGVKKDMPLSEVESKQDDKIAGAESSTSDKKRGADKLNIFLELPQADLHNVCSLLGHEGYVILAFFCQKLAVLNFCLCI